MSVLFVIVLHSTLCEICKVVYTSLSTRYISVSSPSPLQQLHAVSFLHLSLLLLHNTVFGLKLQCVYAKGRSIYLQYNSCRDSHKCLHNHSGYITNVYLRGLPGDVPVVRPRTLVYTKHNDEITFHFSIVVLLTTLRIKYEYSRGLSHVQESTHSRGFAFLHLREALSPVGPSGIYVSDSNNVAEFLAVSWLQASFPLL